MIQLLNQIIAVCMCLGFALAANSQAFPHRAIMIVVRFPPPGTGADTLARLISQKLVNSLDLQLNWL